MIGLVDGCLGEVTLSSLALNWPAPKSDYRFVIVERLLLSLNWPPGPAIVSPLELAPSMKSPQNGVDSVKRLPPDPDAPPTFNNTVTLTPGRPTNGGSIGFNNRSIKRKASV